jgi:hypothetical protein
MLEEEEEDNDDDADDVLLHGLQNEAGGISFCFGLCYRPFHLGMIDV